MRFKSLKGKAINWTFDPLIFENFSTGIWPKIEAVPGHLTCLEAFFLYETARTIGGRTRGVDIPQASTIVEIGSYKGRSSIAIGLGIQANDKAKLNLVCIDPFFNDATEGNVSAEFQENIEEAGVADLITLLPEYSQNAVINWPMDKGIAFLWIDGNHEYEFVTNDFLKWGRHLVPGGIVAFHDAYLIGVRDMISQHLMTKECYQNLCFFDHNLVAATKIDLPPSARQKAEKIRIYWALRTGRTSPWIALLAMFREAVHARFGGIADFFSLRISMR